jgi:RNA-binding protein 8A
LYDLFADYGEIKQIHLNLDRRTGYVKGYAMIEYAGFSEAQNAIDNLNGHALLGMSLNPCIA